MAINVTVTPKGLDAITENEFFDVTFTNNAAFSYAANSNVYFYALLTDATSGTALTREVTFTVHYDTEGTIAINTTTTFTFENTTNLVPTITGSNGRVCYVAQ